MTYQELTTRIELLRLRRDFLQVEMGKHDLKSVERNRYEHVLDRLESDIDRLRRQAFKK